MQLILHCYY